MAARQGFLVRGQAADQRAIQVWLLASLLSLALTLSTAARPTLSRPTSQPLVTVRAPQPTIARAQPAQQPEATRAQPKCPEHSLKTWLTSYRGRTFRVVRLPRCEHIEPVITCEPAGETKEQAQQRLRGVAVCTGSFHHPRTLAIADFVQQNGQVVSAATTGRHFLVMLENGDLDICADYAGLKGKSGVSALALGQRLVPLHRDGFSRAFMSQVTDRMALGLTKSWIYIVQGRSDIWRLADFMKQSLGCEAAVNADGGHVVKGKAPVHIVFRWRKPAPAPLPAPAEAATQTSPAQRPA